MICDATTAAPAGTDPEALGRMRPSARPRFPSIHVLSDIPPPPAHRPPGSFSVVVPTFGRPEHLSRCLGALAAQSRPPDEVLVVAHREDGATLERVAAARRDLPVRAIAVPSRLQVPAMREGVSAASGDVVAFTDDDAAPRADWLALLAKAFEDPLAGAVGGRDVVHDPLPRDAATARRVGVVDALGRPVGRHHLAAPGRREVDFLKGVNLAVRRALCELDDALEGPGNQPHWEIDLCLRLRTAGWRVVLEPAAVVDHYAAGRVAEPQRGSADVAAVAAQAHNEAYALGKWLPPGRRLAAMAFGVAVGYRETPGVLAAVDLLARGQARRAVPAARAAIGGRLRGYRRARRWRARAGGAHGRRARSLTSSR
jgi:Glycosyltransferase like family 2